MRNYILLGAATLLSIGLIAVLCGTLAYDAGLYVERNGLRDGDAAIGCVYTVKMDRRLGVDRKIASFPDAATAWWYMREYPQPLPQQNPFLPAGR